MQGQFHDKWGFNRTKVSIISHVNTLGMLIITATLGLGSVIAQTADAGDAEIKIGTKLANMLRASRGVVSASQPLINNPGVDDKSFIGKAGFCGSCR